MERRAGCRMRNAEVPEKSFLDEATDLVTSLILERGYDNTPMSVIAKALGLTKAGVYHHFESKEDLLYVIHRRMIERLLLPIIERAEQEPEPEIRLRNFLYEHALLMTRDPSARVLINEARRLSPERYEEIRAFWRRGYHVVRSTLATLQASGICRQDINVGYAAFAALGMGLWTVYWFDYSRPEAGPDVASTLSKIFLSGVLVDEGPRLRREPKIARQAKV
jgi:AcrR family transcriptional regulator